MDNDRSMNPTVRAAIEALQQGDREAWAALFEPDATLYDDGSPRSLKKFTHEALGHERFRSIDLVENQGLDLTGNFHSDKWGDFQTYFRFQLSSAGKIKRLDIGQAD
jgi:ketosteroid isomerase-like protein